MSRWTRSRRLLWRIYLYGVVMSLLSAAASLAVGQYVLAPAFEVPARPSTTWIAWHVAELQHEPERLRAELDDLMDRVGIEMSLFEPGGNLVISNAPHPPEPLPAGDLDSLVAEPTHFQGGRGRVAIVDQDGKLANYVLIGYPKPTPFGVAAGQLAVALLVLAILAVPLARSIALPVERLADLTRAFGSGDFSVRARFKGRKDEIGDLARAFDEMTDRLAELRRTELELLANVSHELRTPLSRIRLALELVHDGDARQVTNRLEDIADELAELERLIDDVMTTARLDLARAAAPDGLPPLRKETVMVRELLEASQMRFQQHHPDRALACHVPDSPTSLHVDRILVRRALDNIIDNAAKFSEPDTVVELDATVRDSTIEIAVRDHGIGIIEEDRARVFEPFYRADRSRTRATGGVGLGLALARRIVEAHDGTIEFDSVPGLGSRFVVRLKAAGAGER